MYRLYKESVTMKISELKEMTKGKSAEEVLEIYNLPWSDYDNIELIKESKNILELEVFYPLTISEVGNGNVEILSYMTYEVDENGDECLIDTMWCISDMDKPTLYRILDRDSNGNERIANKVDKFELIKAMNLIVKNMNDENAYWNWIVEVEDGADDESLMWSAENDFEDVCELFFYICKEYGDAGIYLG